MFTEDDKEALRAMREEIEEELREEARRKGKEYGRKLDQIELCYKQHTPAQNQ